MIGALIFAAVLVCDTLPNDAFRPVAGDPDEQTVTGDDAPLVLMLEDVADSGRITLRSRYRTQLQVPAGYASGTYAGTRIATLQRCRFSAGRQWTGAIAAAKAAGEIRAADMLSGNLVWNGTSGITRIVAGDYVAEAGQGLILWRAGDFARGTEIAAPFMRKGRGVVPYTSTGSNAYLSGVAVELRHAGWEGFVMVSGRRMSGIFNADHSLTGFDYSGDHRTVLQLARKDNCTELTAGIHIRHGRQGPVSCGFTLLQTQWSDALSRSAGETPSRYQNAAGADFGWRWKGMTAGGEIAWSGGGPAGVVSAAGALSPEVLLVGSLRYYSPGFAAEHGFGPGESTSDEQGIYIGCRAKPLRDLTFTGYIDLFRRPALAPRPPVKRGRERFFEADYFPDTVNEFRFRWRQTESWTLAGTGAGSTLWRFIYRYRPSGELSFRWLGEAVVSGSERGYGLIQDCTSRADDRFTCIVRVAFFNTPSAATAIRYPEPDLEGSSALPILTGRGMRWSVVLGYSLSDDITLSVKYSEHRRSDVSRIGTGSDALPGNRDNRLGMQLDAAW